MGRWEGGWCWGVGLVAMGVIGAVAGCAGSGPGVVGDDPQIVVHDLEGGMDRHIVGTLEYDTATRCLFLRQREGQNEWLRGLLWPAGTKPIVQDGRRGVDAPGGGRILDGDRVDAGGGSISNPERFNIPEECIPETEFGTTGVLAITQF